MVRRILLQVVGAAPLAYALAYPIDAPVVDLGYARYRGVLNDTAGLNSYFGIRYAKAPIGQLRWQAPVPIDTEANPLYHETLNATTYGPACIQAGVPWSSSSFGFPPITQESEDCLILDVVTPSKPISDKLPVMVQIHGGGYALGDSATAPGQALVHHSRSNLIYVAIQYRLGSFGFLAGDEVKADGVWNAGLLDQRAALEWVQRHIHKFGGDASKVTIIGGSAGGGSVSLQMTMYGGESDPPFRAALNTQYQTFLSAANCSTLPCLRSLPTSALQLATTRANAAAYAARQFAYGTFYWGPAVDGAVVPTVPFAAFRAGAFARVPLLVDHDGFEGVVFSNASLTTTAEVIADLAALWPTTPVSTVADLVALYPASQFNGTALEAQPFFSLLEGGVAASTAFAQRQAVFGDAMIDCPTSVMAGAVSATGEKAWKMVFNAGDQVHGATAEFLFSTTINRYFVLHVGYVDADADEIFVAAGDVLGNATLGAILRDYFVSFAVELDPNAWATVANKPAWQAFKAKEESVLDVEFTSINVKRDPDASKQCEALEEAGVVGF
ncbi:alpha/beta-hydrolase [Glonium stellatum]|uniref:Carboxylic ester hydrolase n=1 Tax=Glonium stellatum TaxID=574774 RepID=A0A8E2JWD2_9PEZI|nr:alpha/beta-hydrolase [Glonium stellatum]